MEEQGVAALKAPPVALNLLASSGGLDDIGSPNYALALGSALFQAEVQKTTASRQC